MDDAHPMNFIGQPVTVEFNTPPAREKAPPCPDRFVWCGETYTVEALLSEWHDFTRRGRMARNMRPAHEGRAAEFGSLGVGRYYFRVRTTSGRIFDLYYDRAIKNTDERKGTWTLFRELAISANDSPANPAPEAGLTADQGTAPSQAADLDSRAD